MSTSPSRRRWRASRRKRALVALPFDRFAAEARPALEKALDARLPADIERAPALSRAIREAVLSPGKRLRPLVALASGEIFRAPLPAATAVAIAVEYLHA